MDYHAAIDYLLGFADFERSSSARREAEAFALDRISSLLARLGRPQDGRLTVHVAGSKGKGSTAAMLEAILRAAGLRTGLFTSPHLDAFNERIRLDGEPLSDAAFAALVTGLQPTIEQELAEKPGRLSTFEALTAMGFAAFRQARVDVQVIEVGLGGRLDSTNVFGAKAAAVITALSYEHTDVLGDSLHKIAWEKAGILTPATRVAILGPQRSAEAAAVVRQYATAAAVPLVDVGQRYAWEPAGMEQRCGQWFRLLRRAPAPGERAAALYLAALLGLHQIENAVTAIAAVDALRSGGLPIPETAVHTGLATVRWPGRLETVARDPWVVVDGAHNGESFERVIESLPLYFPHRRLIAVVGMLRDKRAEEMAARLRATAATVVVTRPQHPRAADPVDVAHAFDGWDHPVLIEPDVASALATARTLAAADDLICVLGSLFVAAEARALCERQGGARPASARSDR